MSTDKGALQGQSARRVVPDPERPFATLNCRTAKVSFTAPLPVFASGGAGARSDHSTSGHE
jgi:hypothetical protein